MSKQNSSGLQSLFAGLTVVLAVVVGIVIYKFIMGAPGNFEGGDPNNHPLPGNFLGIIYKGGFIVPLLIAVNLIVITFSLERFITLGKAKGKGNLEAFVRNIKNLVANNQLDEAIASCDNQKGSLANVVKSGLEKYKYVQSQSGMDKEAKVAAIQKELEEATAIELPMMSKNLVFISTCASIGTLIGLIGTVLGMIRAFAALANAGAPDTAALATGISEALINTAFGIIASTLAIVFYNFFSTKIDSLTYSMDEAGFTIVQEFNASGK